MNNNKEEQKNNIISRLRKIEGQIKGIQNMITESKDCNDVLIQISAVRAAINKVGGLVLDTYIKDCVANSLKEGSMEDFDDIIDTIIKYTK